MLPNFGDGMSHSKCSSRMKSYFLGSIKICQLRIPRSSQGSFFIFSLTSFSSSALNIKREPPSSTNGPPIKMKPSATSRSINAALLVTKGLLPGALREITIRTAEEITTNVFFITGSASRTGTNTQASVNRVNHGWCEPRSEDGGQRSGGGDRRS